MRLAQTQVCPVLRNLEMMAPSTAASRSASSNTRKGALPPSSSEIFFTVEAHCCISSLPTSVEPVKESLRTIGLEVISPPISLAEPVRSEEHTSELQSLMRISYAVFCLKKKKQKYQQYMSRIR